MSLNLVSPGTKVREVDLTIGRVDAIKQNKIYLLHLENQKKMMLSTSIG